jgi:hypothetical protein
MDINFKVKLYWEKFEGNPNIIAKSWTSKDRKGWSPLCKNEWIEGKCLHLQKGKCIDCKNKELIPVNDTIIKNHITGEKKDRLGNTITYGIYSLRPDGTCKFAAIDFDKHPFETVVRVWKKSYEMRIPCFMARSTAKGWHLYFFFEKSTKASLVRNYLIYLFKKSKVGPDFDGMHLPEIFPKQDLIKENEFGNLIKAPLIEPQVLKERNCFVDENNIPIGRGNNIIEEQWKWLEKSDSITNEAFKKVINNKHLHSYQLKGKKLEKELNKEEINTDFMKIINKCEALKEIYDNPLGSGIHHSQRMALVYLAVNTKDGVDILRQLFSNLGRTDKLESYLDYASKRNYRPPTCKYMRENGFCNVTEECLSLQPPMAFVGGRWEKIRDVPREQWANPSPIRFGRMSTNEKKEENQGSGNISHTTINNDNNNNEENEENDFSRGAERYPIDRGYVFAKNNRYYKAIITRRGATISQITNFIIVFEEIYFSEKNEVELYRGYGMRDDLDTKFEIKATPRDLAENLKKTLISRIPSAAILEVGSAYTQVAVFGLGSKTAVNIKYVRFGWNRERNKYYTRNFVITKDGFTKESGYRIRDSIGAASKIDFTLPDDSFTGEKLLLEAILNTHHHDLTFFISAYLFMSVIVEVVSPECPVFGLWVHGKYSSGKTMIVLLLWNMFLKGAKKEDTLSWLSTYKGLLYSVSKFGYVPCVIDDFKLEYGSKITENMINFIQTNFNRTERSVLTKDGSLRKDEFNSSFFVSTGEFPTSNSAASSRTINISTSKPSTEQTEAFNTVSLNKEELNKIMPNFIRWFLKTNDGTALEKIEKYKNFFKDKVENVENRSYDLISYLSFGFYLMMGYLESVGVVNESHQWMYVKFTEAAKSNITFTGEDIKSENMIDSFLDNLSDLIHSGEATILGYSKEQTYPKNILGMIRLDKITNEPLDEYVYFMARSAIYLVNKRLATHKQLQQKALKSMMLKDGLLYKFYEGRGVKLKDSYFGYKRLWCIKKGSLSMTDKPRMVDPKKLEKELKEEIDFNTKTEEINFNTKTKEINLNTESLKNTPFNIERKAKKESSNQPETSFNNVIPIQKEFSFNNDDNNPFKM